MRIQESEINNLLESILSYRPNAKLYLFGSRTDTAKKGGDIDILIVDQEPLNISKKAKVEANFWKAFGPQKIDIVCFSQNNSDPFFRIALKNAIPLN